jgi:hypothetical protein
MASDLAVGRLDEYEQQEIDKIAAQLGIDAHAPWRECEENIATISMMNVASLNLFNHYSAGLEGFGGSDAMSRTKFINLPWWLRTIWLPISFDPLREPLSSDDPLFAGSCQRLLAELAEIQKLSDFGLGNVPEEYNAMRANYPKWWKGLLDPTAEEQAPYSEADTVRWLWRALYDGAQLALQHNAPLSLLG